MNKLLSFGFAKLAFLYLPAAAVVFSSLYFCDLILIEHGLKRLIFIPVVAAIALLLFLFHLILGSTVAEIKNMRSIHKNRAGPSDKA